MSALTGRPIVQKQNPYRSKRLTSLAEHMPCMFVFPHICSGAVMPCHANWQKFGKGVHLKCPDWAWAAGCLNAHREIDGKINPTMTREQREAEWLTAFISTQDFLWATGRIVVRK